MTPTPTPTPTAVATPTPSHTPTPRPTCIPFAGGLTIGYWKTHAGLGAPPRDGTYDYLPIFLGIAPANGDPEQSVDDETEAFSVFSAATGRGLGVDMLKAQLLAARLNALIFPGFDDAYLPNGQTVGNAIDEANQILDAIANGNVHTKDEITHVKDLLDAANNNSHDQVLTTCPQQISLVSGPGDYDGDGFSDDRESSVIGTNSVKPCGNGGWPADLWVTDNGSAVTIQDLTSFLAPVRHLNTSPGDEAYNPRWDLAPNQFGNAISIQDLTSLIAGPTSRPPMLGGEPILGKTCPSNH